MKQGKEIISGGHSAPQACASTEDRQRMIAGAAYYRALARGFARVRRAHPGRAVRISG